MSGAGKLKVGVVVLLLFAMLAAASVSGAVSPQSTYQLGIVAGHLEKSIETLHSPDGVLTNDQLEMARTAIKNNNPLPDNVISIIPQGTYEELEDIYRQSYQSDQSQRSYNIYIAAYWNKRYTEEVQTIGQGCKCTDWKTSGECGQQDCDSTQVMHSRTCSQSAWCATPGTQTRCVNSQNCYKADLAALDITTNPSTITEGDTVTFAATIQNKGTATPASDFTASWYVDSAFIGSATGNKNIYPGSTLDSQFRQSWTATKPGDHIIVMQIDPGKEIPDEDYNNNYKRITIKVKGKAAARGSNTYQLGLVAGHLEKSIETLHSPDGVLTNDQLEMARTAIKNNNPLPSDVSLKLYNIQLTYPEMANIYYQGDLSQRSYDIYLASFWSKRYTNEVQTTGQGCECTDWETISGCGEQSCISTRVKQSRTCSQSAWCATPGTQTRCEDSQNCYKPDLAALDITTSPSTITEGDTVTFAATIQNKGTANTPSYFIARWYVDDTSLGAFTLDSIGPGSTLSNQFQQSWTATPGTHKIVLKIDPESKIPDMDRANNDKETKVYVLIKGKAADGCDCSKC